MTRDLPLLLRQLQDELSRRDALLRELIEDCRNGCYPTKRRLDSIQRELDRPSKKETDDD